MAKRIVQLTPSWCLTTEHSACSYGKPVLVKRQDQSVAYGPRDIYDVPPGMGGMQPAALFVRRFGQHLQGEQREMVNAFLSQWPDGPQLPA
jgi:hypothetical protein